MVGDYQITSFHFQVTFHGLKKFKEKNEKDDIRFQSVSGLNVQYDTESYKEGGENRFEHVIPVRTKYSDLVLKRGIFQPGESVLTQWCINAFDNMKFKPINLSVELLDENHNTLLNWEVIHAYPKNWKLADFNAEKGEVLIETFELSYNYYTLNSFDRNKLKKFDK